MTEKQIIEVASIPTERYKEVIEIRVPIRFHWDKHGYFDGIEIGDIKSKLPWQVDMAKKCAEAIMAIMRSDGVKLAEERKKIGLFLEESKETFHAVYRDSAGEQTYTIARHAIDKIITSLKAGQPLDGRARY